MITPALPSSEQSAPADRRTELPPLLYATLLLAMIGPALTFVTLPPSLPLIADHFGGGASGQRFAQAAQACSFVGGLLGGLAAGSLIARTSLRLAMIAAALLYAAGGVSAMFALAMPMLLAGCLVVGMMGSVLSSGLAMATGAVMTGERRARMLGYQAGASDVTGVISGLGAGLLALWLGWRGPFLVYIVFGLLAALLAALSRPTAPVHAPEATGGFVAALRLAWPVYCGSILLSIMIGTLQLQLPFHLAAHGITSPADRALVQTCSTFAAACASISFGFLIGRVGERLLLLVGGIAAVIGFSSYALWHGGFSTAAAAAIATGITIGLGMPLLFTFALRRTPPALHAYSIGILNVSIFLGGALSPLVLGPVAAYAGMAASFAGCAAIGAAGSIGFAIALGRSARPSPAMAR